ncbi:aldehyde dehydrogenase family protein [Cereibacter johrii]|uniref:aldehyde dehydrogenase family protein n=1 Tax=Cereibacter johrii TaxID=445629 RepID=UPI003CEA72D5
MAAAYPAHGAQAAQAGRSRHLGTDRHRRPCRDCRSRCGPRAASRGFAVRASTGVFERCRLMHRAAEQLRERAPGVAANLTREQGKPRVMPPVIVCANADLDKAVRLMAGSKRRSAGQVCVSPKRFLVQEEVIALFLSGFAAAMQAALQGNGQEDGVQLGPLANDRRVAALETLVADAVEQGARPATGGKRIGNVGNFFPATVLAEVPLSARIMHEEPFGPLAIVNRFSMLEEAIAEANRLPYRLASYAFTRSVRTMQRLGLEIDSGMTTINHLGLALFGGAQPRDLLEPEDDPADAGRGPGCWAACGTG